MEASPVEILNVIFEDIVMNDILSIMLTSKFFHNYIIKSSKLYNLLLQAKKIVITEKIDDHPSNIVINWNLSYKKLRENLIDYYSMFTREIFIESTNNINDSSNNINDEKEIREILASARNRDIGDIFLYPVAAKVVGTPSVDAGGFKCGNYGLEDNSWFSCVDCWICNWKNSNWPRGISYKIDEYLHVNLFYGKREGDYIEFTHNERHVKLRLNQMNYRYNRGTFEDVCTKSLKSRGGLWDPHYPNDISQNEQIRILNKAQDDYTNSYITLV